MPSISPQQAQQLIQAQMLQQLQSAVQAGHIPPALASVPPTPSLFIQLHHLVQLQQVLQRLQLQQASAYAAHQQARLPRLPSVRPDALAIKIAKIRQQIVALHLQIKQTVRQQQLLSAAAAVGTTTNLPPDSAAFDASRDLARDFSGAMMMHDDWKPVLAESSPSSGAPDLSHSVTPSLETWPGWPVSLLTGAPPLPESHPHVSDGSEVSSTAAAAALDIEEFIPGKPWQGPTIRSVEDDPFITPGGASSSVVVSVDEKSPGSVTQHNSSSSSNNGWTTSAGDESGDRGCSVTARAPPGLVPSSPWLQQPAFTRSTSWTPQSNYGELYCRVELVGLGGMCLRPLSASALPTMCECVARVFHIINLLSCNLVSTRVRPIWVKRPMSDVPIFRRKNSDVRFRFRCRSC